MVLFDLKKIKKLSSNNNIILLIENKINFKNKINLSSLKF